MFDEFLDEEFECRHLFAMIYLIIDSENERFVSLKLKKNYFEIY